MTAADRQARSRAKRAAAGCSRVSVTLSPEAAKALERLRAHHGGTIAETIERTLIDEDHRKTCTVRPYPNPLANVIKAGVDPFGAEFVAGLVPDPGKAPSAVWIDEHPPCAHLATAPVRGREEFAGMPDPLEAIRGMPSPVDPRKPR